MLITFTSQVMVVWPLILRYFVEKNIISLIVAVVYLAVCASTFYIYLCIYNYATFNIEIVSIAVHNYTYAYVKAMKEVVLSQDIGSEESLRQLKKLRKDWEWHLKINKQRDDNKVMRVGVQENMELVWRRDGLGFFEAGLCFGAFRGWFCTTSWKGSEVCRVLTCVLQCCNIL